MAVSTTKYLPSRGSGALAVLSDTEARRGTLPWKWNGFWPAGADWPTTEPERASSDDSAEKMNSPRADWVVVVMEWWCRLTQSHAV